MYVKLQKYLKEVTILHFFRDFFVCKAQFMKINEAKTSILCLAYICEKKMFYLKSSCQSTTITDTGQIRSILCLVSRAILVFLLTARDVRLTSHDRAFQIVI